MSRTFYVAINRHLAGDCSFLAAFGDERVALWAANLRQAKVLAHGHFKLFGAKADEVDVAMMPRDSYIKMGTKA